MHNQRHLASATEREDSRWSDWKWQQQAAIHTVEQLCEAFPGLSDDLLAIVGKNILSARMQLTPYLISLIRRRPDGAPEENDPLWRQFIPRMPVYQGGAFSYDGKTDNWEVPKEMVTSIAQHKYPNRIIIRISNVCHGYCQFCYEALRTLERKSSKDAFQQDEWIKTVNYVRESSAIEEVILSGGEPLMRSDESLDRMLTDLRNIDRPLALRLHTRALTLNPFRITDDLLKMLEPHRLSALGLHVSHPNELTEEFISAVERLRAVTPIMFANIPLLAGINDDADVMHALCMDLYRIGVIPHYLYHFMPYSPSSGEFRTTVQRGVDIVRQLKRRVTNLAVPEFVLPHYTGKYTMPLFSNGEELPQRWSDTQDVHFIRFTNWKGQLVDYYDGCGRNMA